jgi:hypothetical protein
VIRVKVERNNVSKRENEFVQKEEERRRYHYATFERKGTKKKLTEGPKSVFGYEVREN